MVLIQKVVSKNSTYKCFPRAHVDPHANLEAYLEFDNASIDIFMRAHEGPDSIEKALHSYQKGLSCLSGE
jgi:hypothetical protein